MDIWADTGLDWGSHLPALIGCVAASEGDVLELGCGHYSTPCLHALCGSLGRNLMTLEAEQGWRDKFTKYSTTWHDVAALTQESVSRAAAKDNWGVVFVDDAAGGRTQRANMFIDKAEFVLFHDYNFPDMKPPLDEFLANNKCQSFVYREYGPHTLIVSASRDIPNLWPTTQ